MIYRICILVLLTLMVVVGYQLPSLRIYEQIVLNTPAVAYPVKLAWNILDMRPTVAVLFIGNSRTYYNDMPDIERKITDSIPSKHKYGIAT